MTRSDGGARAEASSFRVEGRLLALAAAAIAGLALFERLARLPLLPFADNDAWSYLRPALLLFTEGDYLHTGSRAFVYPVFVHGVLRLSGSWSGVVVTQHLLGVAGGLVLLATWLRIPLPTEPTRRICVLRGVLGLGLLAAHLFLAQTMTYEHTLRPEAISQPVAAAVLFGAVGVVCASRDRPRRLLADATLLVLGAALLAALRPQTLLVLPATLGLLGVVLVRLGPKPGTAALVLALPLTAALLGIWIPERALASRDPLSGRFLSGVLFFWHFHLIDDVLREDLREGGLAPQREVLVRKLFDAFEAEKRRHARAGKWYRFQGYNPDRLYYGRAGDILHAHFGEDSEAYQAFALRSFLRAVVARPLAYLEKVLVNLGNVYTWPRGRIVNHRLDFNLPRFLDITQRRMAPRRELLCAHPSGEAYLSGLALLRAELGRPEDPRSWVFGSKRIARAMEAVYHLLNRLHVPLLLATAGLLAWGSRRDERRTAAIALAALGLAFAAHLTSATVHGLETMRYVFGVAGLSLFGVFAALLHVAVRMLRGRDEGGSPPAIVG